MNQQRPANRTGWVGTMDFAEAGTPDRWGYVEDALVRSRGALAVGYPTYLPSVPPPLGSYMAAGSDYFLGGVMLQPYGAAERPWGAPIAGGENFYGWTPGAAPGQSGGPFANDALGAGESLVDANGYYYSGDLSLSMVPQYSEPDPWMRPGLYG